MPFDISKVRSFGTLSTGFLHASADYDNDRPHTSSGLQPFARSKACGAGGVAREIAADVLTLGFGGERGPTLDARRDNPEIDCAIVGIVARQMGCPAGIIDQLDHLVVHDVSPPK